jgi:hypothetical protein
VAKSGERAPRSTPAGEALAAELLAAADQPAAAWSGKLGQADSATGLAAVAALGRSRQAAAVPILVAAAEAEAELPARLRKEARRELHRLRALGLDVPAPRPPPPPAPAAERRARVVEAWATPFDGTGSRALWMMAERPLGGVYAIGLAVNDQTGLRLCSVDETTRRRFTEHLQRRRADSQVVWVRLPADYARRLVGEALALNQESGQAVPRAYQTYERAVEEPTLPFEQALIYDEIPAAEVNLSPELLEASPELLSEPELRGWMFNFDDVRGFALDLLQARQSQIVLSEQLKAERQQRIVANAIRDVVTPAMQHGFRRRLEETAYLFLQSDRLRQARLALAAAQRLAEGASTLHPLLQALMLASLEIASEVETGQIPIESVRRSDIELSE